MPADNPHHVTRLEAACRAHPEAPKKSDLARALGVHRSTVSKLLMGTARTESPKRRGQIEQLLASVGIVVDGDPWALVEVASAPAPTLQLPAARRQSSTPSPTSTPSVGDADDQPSQEDEMIPCAPDLTFRDLKYWKLQDDPFDIVDLDDIWVHPGLTWMERRLERGIRGYQIMLVAGRIGSGKSVLMRRLRARLGPAQGVLWLEPGNIDRRRIDDGALELAMLRAMGHEATGWPHEKRGEFLREELLRLRKDGTTPALAIDEAHRLPDQAFIAIKEVWDSYGMNRNLSVVLFGQPAGLHRIRRNRMLEEFTLRCRVVEFPELDLELAHEYLDWRLKRVGRSADELFEPKAIERLHQRGGVTPLALNALAGRALQAGRLCQAERVTVELAGVQ